VSAFLRWLLEPSAWRSYGEREHWWTPAEPRLCVRATIVFGLMVLALSCMTGTLGASRHRALEAWAYTFVWEGASAASGRSTCTEAYLGYVRDGLVGAVGEPTGMTPLPAPDARSRGLGSGARARLTSWWLVKGTEGTARLRATARWRYFHWTISECEVIADETARAARRVTHTRGE
jgi:hypothetical protein